MYFTWKLAPQLSLVVTFSINSFFKIFIGFFSHCIRPLRCFSSAGILAGGLWVLPVNLRHWSEWGTAKFEESVSEFHFENDCRFFYDSYRFVSNRGYNTLPDGVTCIYMPTKMSFIQVIPEKTGFIQQELVFIWIWVSSTLDINLSS